MAGMASRGLPRDETAFFGRAAELAEIDARLTQGGEGKERARLVTVVGLGGMGKSRVAIRAAGARASTVYASLAEATSLEAAVRTIATAARVPLKAESQAKSALDTLASALAKKGSLLLVLDDVDVTGMAGEGARTLVTGLLEGTKDLVILATAREPIGARGEEKIVLAPLDEEGAMGLLRDRARQAAGTAVEMTDDEARAIVTRLDRLPLAIELAASRLEVLSAGELVKRLSEPKSPLAIAGTMRATLDGSWESLSDVEKSVLAQASIFAAPFGIEAAEEIVSLPARAEGDGDDDRSGDVLDALESLVKRSLLTRTAGADGKAYARLAMFETVRAWAREKLDARDRVALAKRHAGYHLAEAEHAALRAYGAGAIASLDRLEELLPELQGAFAAMKEREPRTAVRIVLALSDLLLFRGLFELRADLFDRGVAAAERAGDEPLLARALVAKARVTLELGRMQDAEKELRRALELAEKCGDDVTRAEATRSLGWALTALGRTEEAEAALESARAMHRDQGSPRGLADAHVALGILRALGGRPAEGLQHLRDALAIHVEQGDVIRQEKVLGFGGLVGHDAKELARGLPREVLARAPKSSLDVLPVHVAELVKGEAQSETHQRWQLAIDLYRQGVSADERGDADAAIAAFDRAIATLERSGVKRGALAIHAHAAAVFAMTGDDAEATARLDRARKAAADPHESSGLVLAVFETCVELMRSSGSPPERLEQARALLERATRAEVLSPELSVATRVLDRVLRGIAPGPAEGGDGDAEDQQSRPSLPPLSRLPSGSHGAELVVGKESRWIIPPRGERIDLVRYGPVRRLLDRLVNHRLAEPGNALSAEALIEAGWPGERMRHTAGLLRVYSAVRRLRRLGLEPVLITRDDGYLLDPHANVRRDDT